MSALLDMPGSRFSARADWPGRMLGQSLREDLEEVRNAVCRCDEGKRESPLDFDVTECKLYGDFASDEV